MTKTLKDVGCGRKSKIEMWKCGRYLCERREL